MPLKTVLLDATPLARGHANRGIGAYTANLIAALGRRPESDRPALMTTRGQRVPDTTFTRQTVRWPGWPVGRLPDPWPGLGVERQVRRLRPGLFHATQPELIPDARHLAVTATCYDLIPLHEPSRNPAHRWAARRAAERLGRARLILAISQATADDLVATLGVDPGRISVTPLGVGASPPPSGWTPDGPFVLYANGIEPHKNAGLVIRAIARTRNGTRLVMTGTWSARRRDGLMRLAQTIGAARRIDWLGHVPAPQLAALRAATTAALVPSRREGFGLPVVEALAAGARVIAADIPVLREVGGDAATYLPADDPDVWAAAIDRHVEHVDDGAAARRAHAAAFTWDRTAELTVDAWRGVLS